MRCLIARNTAQRGTMMRFFEIAHVYTDRGTELMYPSSQRRYLGSLQFLWAFY